jgi:hypothetical protein
MQSVEASNHVTHYGPSSSLPYYNQTNPHGEGIHIYPPSVCALSSSVCCSIPSAALVNSLDEELMF